MTDYPWKLTKPQLDRIHEHIRRFMTDGCWICELNEWRVHPYLIGEKPFDPEAKYVAIADSGPKVRIACGNCGNVVYFSADVMQLPMNAEQTDD